MNDGHWQTGIVTAETALAGAMFPAPVPAAAVQREVTLSQYARLWLAGQEGAVDAGLNQPLDAYAQSLWVYRCLSEIQRTCAGLPLRLIRTSEAVRYSRRSYRLEIRSPRNMGNSTGVPPVTRCGHRRDACATGGLRPVRGCRAICLGRAAEGEPIESGPAADLWGGPNSYSDWPAFLIATIGRLYLSGSVAWVGTEMTGPRPRELHVVDGCYVKPVWVRDQSSELPWLLGYEYTAPKSRQVIRLSLEECKFFRLWSNASDPLAGLSPLRPGRLAIASEYNASLYNASALASGGEPGVVAELPDRLTEEQREQFRMNWIARFQGPAKAKRLFILEGGGKVNRFSDTLKEMEFSEGKRTNRLEICCLMGVPPVVAGWVDAAGDSSAYTQNALRQFYQQTVFPLLDMLAPAVQEITSRFDAAAATYFDAEDQPVVQELRLSRVDTAGKLFAMGWPRNDINEALDLGLPDTPDGDVGYLPAGLLPASDVAAGNVFPAIPEGPEQEEPTAEAQRAQRLSDSESEPSSGLCASAVKDPSVSDRRLERIWRRFAASWEPLAKRGATPIRVRLYALQRQLIARIRAEFAAESDRSDRSDRSDPSDKSDKPRPRKAPAPASIDRILFEVFRDPAALAQFRVRLTAVLRDGRELGLRQALAEAGLAGEQLDEALRRLLANPAIEAALRSEAVVLSTRVDAGARNALRTSLIEGSEAGEDVRHLADRVQAVMGNRRRDAINQARNAVGQALSVARHDGHRAGGMSHKGWVHSRGPGERRPAHIAAEVHYMAAPIRLEERFRVGEAMLLYPRDASAGAPAETINCQCLQIALRLPAGAPPPTARELLDAHEAAPMTTYADMRIGLGGTGVPPVGAEAGNPGGSTGETCATAQARRLCHQRVPPG